MVLHLRQTPKPDGCATFPTVSTQTDFKLVPVPVLVPRWTRTVDSDYNFIWVTDRTEHIRTATVSAHMFGSITEKAST